ncbi:MAG: M55 family metallopeptidase, partial [Clostridia bacterium]
RRDVTRLIREGAAEAVSARNTIPPKVIPAPVTFRLEFKRSTQAEVACLLPMVTRIDARTVEVSGHDMVEGFRMAKGLMRLASTCDA